MLKYIQIRTHNHNRYIYIYTYKSTLYRKCDRPKSDLKWPSSELLKIKRVLLISYVNRIIFRLVFNNDSWRWCANFKQFHTHTYTHLSISPYLVSTPTHIYKSNNKHLDGKITWNDSIDFVCVLNILLRVCELQYEK